MKSRSTFFRIAQTSLRFIFVVISALQLHGQKNESPRIAFYNLENLFHPSNDSLTNDDEFTPEGMRNWSTYRYHEKVNHMAKAILSIGEWQPPAIVGLAEIENRQTLEDLTNTEVLRKFNYGIVHFDSPDRRGIDVGMIYRQDYFHTITTEAIAVTLKDDPNFKTRDILYTKGVFNTSDTIHLFFCHWPSRYGGQARSEPKRIRAAVTLREITDSLQNLPYPAYIITAGDLNDEWNNISVKDSLKAKPFKDGISNGLVNLMATMPVNQGSHRYRGTWSYLDQIIVSGNMLNGDGAIQIKNHSAKVVNHEFLLTTDDRYPGYVPFRTFIGMKYVGGFSDHLPIYVELQFE